MQGFLRADTWQVRPMTGWRASDLAEAVERGAAAAAMLLLMLALVANWTRTEMAPGDMASAPAAASPAGDTATAKPPREILVAGYAGFPYYHRSDVHMTRPNGTDLTLKQLGWDGDALYFPIDGGIRSMEWWHSVGFMVDFLHNKAIARLGKGAHGRKLANPVIEEVEAEGTLNGKPAPPRIKLTDVWERFEFTHGHNMLFFTGLLRPGNITPRIRPYFGVGAGFAMPHVEVWFPGGEKGDRTSEYQYAGPAAEAVAGLEFRVGRVSYFVEYKYSWAHLMGAITGDESWLNFMLPGDLMRQFGRWWRGEEPPLGRFETTLTAHQVVGGVGYWWQPGGAGTNIAR